MEIVVFEIREHDQPGIEKICIKIDKIPKSISFQHYFFNKKRTAIK